MISPPVLLASSESGVFFWVLVITFWVVSSLIQKSREKKELEKKRAAARERQNNAPAEPVRETRNEPRPPPASRPEDELRRFLEEITGRVSREEQPGPAESEEAYEPPPPPIVVRRPSQDQKTSRRGPPAIVLDAPAPARPTPAPVIPAGVYETLGEIEDIEVLMDRQAATLYSGEGVVHPDGMLVNLSKIRVPLMPMPLVSLRSNRNRVDHPPVATNAKALREALITRTLLSPCKALEGMQRD